MSQYPLLEAASLSRTLQRARRLAEEVHRKADELHREAENAHRETDEAHRRVEASRVQSARAQAEIRSARHHSRGSQDAIARSRRKAKKLPEKQ